jgi:hypothetical protein
LLYLPVVCLWEKYNLDVNVDYVVIQYGRVEFGHYMEQHRPFLGDVVRRRLVAPSIIHFLISAELQIPVKIGEEYLLLYFK